MNMRIPLGIELSKARREYLKASNNVQRNKRGTLKAYWHKRCEEISQRLKARPCPSAPQPALSASPEADRIQRA